jgi:hypothetical protein
VKIFWRDQGARLGDHLDEFRDRPFSKPAAAPEASKYSAPVARGPCDLRDCDLGFLFRYHVFPRRLMTFCADWEREERPMRLGDTIALQAQMPPGWGLRLVFGVRVVAVFREQFRAGFRYRTLAGHPESGENEFSFVASAAQVSAVIRTHAGYGSPLGRALGPVFARPYARYSNRRALVRMTQAFAAANPRVAGIAPRPSPQSTRRAVGRK